MGVTIALDALALCLRLPHSELFGYETVLDHLVNVLFLSEGTLVVEVHISHLLADVGLVHTLRVMPHESVIHEALTDEVTVKP